MTEQDRPGDAGALRSGCRSPRQPLLHVAEGSRAPSYARVRRLPKPRQATDRRRPRRVWSIPMRTAAVGQRPLGGKDEGDAGEMKKVKQKKPKKPVGEAAWKSDACFRLLDGVTLPKPTPVVLASAISAWSLILSALTPWSISSYNWQESISFLSTLLDKDDHSVRIAAGEAIALIFDIGRPDKFSKEENIYKEDSDDASSKAPRAGFTYVEALKGKILNQAKNLSMEAGGKGSAKNDLSSQRETFQDIVAFIETGSCHEHPVKILNKCDPLVVSTWTQMMQLNFLRRFLGRGFLKHMQDNELLHDVFDFTPRKKENLSVKEKRLFLSPNSVANKDRTQFLNKRRTWTKDWKQGHFRVGVEDDGGD